MVGDIIRISGTSGDMDATRDVLLTYVQVAKVGYVYADVNLRPPGAPLNPYIMCGYTNGTGGQPLPGCSVVLKNLVTGASLSTISSSDIGFYELDLNLIPGGWMVGDTIRVTATLGAAIGTSDVFLVDSGVDSVSTNLTLS